MCRFPSLLFLVVATLALGAAIAAFPGGPGNAPAAPLDEPVQLRSGGTPTPTPEPTPDPLPPNANRYWYDRTKQIAEEFGLGPFFKRQIMQESGYRDEIIDGRVVSSAGAQGIAQIVPRLHPNVDPLDPEAALHYAARFMARMIVRYNGSVPKALAAYHSGPRNVDRAVAAAGDDWKSELGPNGQKYLAVITRSDEGELVEDWPEFWARWHTARSSALTPAGPRTPPAPLPPGPAPAPATSG